MAKDQDTFLGMISEKNAGEIIEIIASVTGETFSDTMNTFYPLVGRTLGIARQESDDTAVLTGEEQFFQSGIYEVFIKNVKTGEILRPDIFTFDEAVNLRTDFSWAKRRGNGVIADVFWWLSMHKDSLKGESEQERRVRYAQFFEEALREKTQG